MVQASTIWIGVVGALFLLGFFALYVKRCSKTCPEALQAQPINPAHPSDVPPQGVDAAFLETLPLVTYSSSKKKGFNVECVVCLTDFKEGEPLLQLPRCKHVFHHECIDMWLYSHTTCPLCRRSVLSDGSCSFRWGRCGSLRLSVGRRSQRESGSATPREAGDGSPSQRDPNVDMELGGVAPRGVRSFPRSHSTGHSLMSVGTPHYSNTKDAEPRMGCLPLTATVEFRRSRSLAAVQEDAPAPVTRGAWMREAGASLRRTLSLTKASSAATNYGIPVGLAASSSTRSTFDQLSLV